MNQFGSIASVFLCIVVLFSACGQQKPAKNILVLPVTTDTLSPIALCFSPPQKWAKLDSQNLNTLAKQIGKHFGSVSFQVLSGYIAENGSGCTITRLSPKEAPDSGFSDSAITSYFDSEKKRLAKLGAIKAFDYEVDKYNVFNTRVSYAGTIMYSLVYRNIDTHQAFQIDYLVPIASADSSTIRAITASSVSVHPMQR